MNAMQSFDLSTIKTYIIWLMLTYGVLLFAMLIDLITGVQKAKKMGIARTSQGYKMTCVKAEKYFLPMLCLTCLDLIGSVIFPAPFFTMLLGAFNLFCEFKSVLEKTHEKAEIREAANTLNVVVKNKDDLAKAVASILNDMANKNTDNDKS